MTKNNVTVTSATGSAAIDTTTEIKHNFRLSSFTIHFSAAPVTSEDLTITVKAKDGTVYDAVLYSIDPSASSAVSIVYTPSNDLVFEKGDEINVAYTNTDARTYGLRICTQSL